MPHRIPFNDPDLAAPVLDDDEAEALILVAALPSAQAALPMTGRVQAELALKFSMLGRYTYMGRGLWISNRVLNQEGGNRATEILCHFDRMRPEDRVTVVWRVFRSSLG